MVKGATIRPAQIERARKLLQDLPEKDDRKTREEAAGLLERDFRKALNQGYTPKELSAMLKSADIVIPAYLVEKFLQMENTHPRPKITPKPKPEKEPGKEAVTAPAAGQFTITPDTALEEL